MNFASTLYVFRWTRDKAHVSDPARADDERTPRTKRAVGMASAAAVATALALGAGFFAWHRLAQPSSLVPIPSGELDMGSDDGEPDERPAHRVHIYAFEIDPTEVTTEAYAACVRAGACRAASTFHASCNAAGADTARHPANCVTWAQAGAFCQWRGARLPTEEEWEYAARGPKSQHYPWGDVPSTDKSCWNRPAGKTRTCAVGSFPADTSPFGLVDMAGNVAEWTQSPYCAYDGGVCKPGARVIKGGSCDMTQQVWLRSSYRDFVGENESGYNLGFRCARSKD
jgi:formylglycine-generating enzyme required for sulfatase activity